MPRSAELPQEQNAFDSVSFIVPVFNEHENFPLVVAELERHAPEQFQLFMVYDFDEDSTVPVAEELRTTRPWLVPVKNEYGRGVVNALRYGFDQVQTGPAVVVMGDLSDDLSIIPDLVRLYGEGYSIVCPSRYMPGGRQEGGPWLKGMLSRTAGKLLYWVARFPVQDATNSFRLYDAKFVHAVGIESTGGFEIALELTAKAFRLKKPITEVPTTWRDREAGDSNFRLVRWLPRYLYWFFYALGFGRLRHARVAE